MSELCAPELQPFATERDKRSGLFCLNSARNQGKV